MTFDAWVRADAFDPRPLVAYEVLELPDGRVWWAPCGTADPLPESVQHRYYRHLPSEPS